ncbi:acyl-CoA N-acyltransferase [Mycena crocata]|nr:acyl-CoA N-acyltransferase [Mycena crocata]
MSQPYIRDARPTDLEEIASFEARAFAEDPEMNWFAGLSTAISDQPPPQNVRSLNNLGVFLDSINRGVDIVGGRITVVAIPQDTGPEKIVAFASWIPPHKIIEGTLTTIRSKAYRSILTTIVFKPTIGAIVKRALTTRGYGETDHYRLEITATDPEHQGKGYSGLLMKESFAMYREKPMTLEATTEHSRDIYAHQGFEVVETVTLGKGEVSSRGLKVKDTDSAVGFPVHVMIKWPTTK